MPAIGWLDSKFCLRRGLFQRDRLRSRRELIAVHRKRKSNFMTKVRLVAVVALILCFCPCLVISATESNHLVVSRISTQSNGRRIRIDKYATSRSGKHPAILVLHGAGGTLLDGPEMRRVARQLAESGHTVYLVHYFDRTGTIFGFDAGMQEKFPAWLETVRDSIKFVRQSNADSSPVGIYGYSLGGFLALAAASDNPGVGAVVEHAGGIWNGKTEHILHTPPVLIVHGEGDRRVPFQKYARPLVAVMRQRGAVYKTRFFPGEGHVFSAPAMSEVRAAAVEFFREHLVKNEAKVWRRLPPPEFLSASKANFRPPPAAWSCTVTVYR
jgi:dienelactone hydrolase